MMRPLLAFLALSSPVEARQQVSVTFYTPTGREGACRHPVRPGHLAVSRDLLRVYPCGTRLTLTLDRRVGGRRVITGIVGDTMAAHVTRTVDVLVRSEGTARRYGRVAATVRGVR